MGTAGAAIGSHKPEGFSGPRLIAVNRFYAPDHSLEFAVSGHVGAVSGGGADGMLLN